MLNKTYTNMQVVKSQTTKLYAVWGTIAESHRHISTFVTEEDALLFKELILEMAKDIRNGIYKDNRHPYFYTAAVLDDIEINTVFIGELIFKGNKLPEGS